jgi:tetratricopeptide (TPR) repeat protein
LLGECLISKGNYVKAEKYLRTAIELNDKSFEALNTLGVCLMRQHKFAESELYLRKALAVNPNSSLVRENLEICMKCQQNVSVAKRELEKILSIGYNKRVLCTLALRKGEVVRLDLKIIRGGAIDLFLMDKENFLKFREGLSYQYYLEFSGLNLKQKSGTFRVPKSENYYLIFDNMFSSDGSNPDILNNRGIVEVKLRMSFPGKYKSFLARFQQSTDIRDKVSFYVL